MTLGNGAAAKVRLIVWCKFCGQRAKPDVASLIEAHGANVPVPAWMRFNPCSDIHRGQMSFDTFTGICSRRSTRTDHSKFAAGELSIVGSSTS